MQETLTSPFDLVKKLIEEKFDEKLSLHFLSRSVGINEYKLKTGFKELFGTSVRQCQIEIKMTEAKRLLIETDEKISSIAYMIGYEHPNNFSLEFRKRFGVGPRDWRKKQIN
jgi:AraC family transcriptional regulator, transcriptional activator of the genes for pyochelin and ferripyochelin receptors